MSRANNPIPVEHPQTASSPLFAMNERLTLALKGSGQLVFDWHILSDELFFSGSPSDGLSTLLLDTRTTCSSRVLPPIIHDDDKENLAVRLHDALKGKAKGQGDCYNAELRLKDSVRKWRWVSINGRIVARDTAGRALRMVGTFSDIDDRKRAERKIARLRDLHVVISQTNQAIVRFSSRLALFEEACRNLVEQAGFRTAWIGSVNQQTRQISLAAARGPLAPTLISIDMDIPESHKVVGRAVLENQVVVCNDVDSSSGSNQYCSVACLPLRTAGSPVAVLTLYAEEMDFFSKEILNLLEELAHDISFAIESYDRQARRKAMEAALLDSEKIKSAILTAALDSIVSFNRYGEIIDFNQAAELTFGYRSEDVIGRKLADIIFPAEWRERHQQTLEGFLGGEENQVLNRRIELTALRCDGSTFPIELAIVALDVQNEPIFTAFIRDISERKRSESIQLEQNRILNMVATGLPLQQILMEVARFAERYSNQGLCSILLLNGDGTVLENATAPSLPQTYLMLTAEIPVGPGGSSCGTAVFRGEPVVVSDIASDPLWDAQRQPALEHGLRACTSWPIFGKHRKILGSFALYYRDKLVPPPEDQHLFGICTHLAGIAIESRQSEERIRYLAHYDGLTSLPNRFLFKDQLDQALRNARRHGKKFGVLFLDLDKFKEINDTLGHDAGDLVLRETAKRLRGCLRHSDKIARMGGDEFYVLIEDLSDGRYAADVAQKLLDAASQPVLIGTTECRLSVSIGIAIYPDDGGDGQTLLKNADNAMYRAKELGKNGFCYHTLPHSLAASEPAALAHLNRVLPMQRVDEKLAGLA